MNGQHQILSNVLTLLALVGDECESISLVAHEARKAIFGGEDALPALRTALAARYADDLLHWEDDPYIEVLKATYQECVGLLADEAKLLAAWAAVKADILEQIEEEGDIGVRDRARSAKVARKALGL